jgi:hypothetical protein
MKLTPKTRTLLLIVAKVLAAFLLFPYVYYLFSNPLTDYLGFLFAFFKLDIGFYQGNWFVLVPLLLITFLVIEIRQDMRRRRLGKPWVWLKYCYFIPLVLLSLYISLGQVSN